MGLRRSLRGLVLAGRLRSVLARGGNCGAHLRVLLTHSHPVTPWRLRAAPKCAAPSRPRRPILHGGVPRWPAVPRLACAWGAGGRVDGMRGANVAVALQAAPTEKAGLTMTNLDQGGGKSKGEARKALAL